MNDWSVNEGSVDERGVSDDGDDGGVDERSVMDDRSVSHYRDDGSVDQRSVYQGCRVYHGGSDDGGVTVSHRYHCHGSDHSGTSHGHQGGQDDQGVHGCRG